MPDNSATLISHRIITIGVYPTRRFIVEFTYSNGDVWTFDGAQWNLQRGFRNEH